jgi:integrase
MANIKYIIRTYNGCTNKDGKSIILLRYTHKSKVTYLSSGQTISPEFWDERNQKVKHAYKGFTQFNVFLDKFRVRIEDHVHQALSEDKEPTVEYIKEKVRTKKVEKASKKAYISFFNFFESFIESSVLTKAPKTIIGYRNSFKHLKAFEEYSNQSISWEMIDMNFYHDYRDYLFKVNKASNNHFGKQIKTIKTVLNDAIERGYEVNLSFKSKKFKVLSEDADSIYLDENELSILINLDLSKNSKLEKVRDLFIVGCYTGLRFSDFSEIKPENIKKDFIQITTKKTNQFVVIPYHPCVRNIMEKYKERDNSLPKALTNQKMNDYLKVIGKLAGLDEIIVINKSRAGNRVKTNHKKYELLTTHCARRSFATNLFKQGFPGINIMKITGHRTEKAFMRYIKVNEQEAAVMLKKHWDDFYSHRNSSEILKIA